eukprot:CAMPEP_0172490104 /NCGR_PEP_ID=MMETSP1066-20121228/20448_1 /TAXON_ID=671091 /ORGANISM="Coscinodiscus wailesii, Strain CCMP2513" /LENGTH=778 /DNA_ID=CAMNT_0013258417 /DNA_START=99 /DNA_END=2435 /DNA_ORIENTATION=-
MKVATLALLLSVASQVTLLVASDPVEIVVGADPDQFNMGWSDGVCYLPITNARAGDMIRFDFFLHNVYKMTSREKMESCDFSDATLLSSSSPYTYTISAADVASGDDLYFACEIGSHCFGEQRIAVSLSDDTGPRTDNLPVSKFVLGASSSSCAAVRRGEMDASAASRMAESECSEPEYREANEDIDRPHYFRSCLGPPITLTPGGVINQALLLHFPFPLDRRVLLGTRMWEFVQGDLDNLKPVHVNQLYVHHIAGSVVLGNGAENIRQSAEDAAFPLPYGMLTGDINDRMTFHVIDLRETGDEWLECLECRCKDGEGTYLGIGGSGSEGGDDGPGGGVSCCNNCTDLVGPTVDYRLRYNVTYTELSDIDTPIDPITMITADIAPAIDRYVEFDVPQWENLPGDQVLQGNSKVQVIERVGTLRELFGGFFQGARYTGNDLVKIHRCIGHLHIAALGMWLYDDVTNELLCHNDVEYGDDPETDKGFLRAITVTNYEPPLQVLADKRLKLVTHYDAEILHTGVMGLLFLMISEGKQKVGVIEAKLKADLCMAPFCDVSAVLPNGSCRDSIEDSIVCQFGGLCSCTELLSIPDTIGGCEGVYTSSFGNLTVGSLCAEHCGCAESLLEESIVEQIEDRTKELCQYSGKNCTHYLANVYACSQPWVEGADGFEETVMGVVARRGKQMALDGTKLGSKSMHRFNDVDIETLDIATCDPNDFPAREELTDTAVASEASGSNVNPLYFFPLVVVALIAGLAFYAKKVRRNNSPVRGLEMAVDAENV